MRKAGVFASKRETIGALAVEAVESELKAMSTEERIRRLESAVRRLSWLNVVFGIVAGFALFLFFQKWRDSRREHRIEAESFVLKDATGKTRGLWSATGAEPGLMLADEKGIERVRMGIIEQGPYIGLQDAEGRLRVGVTEARGGGLTLLDENSKDRLSLSCPDAGAVIAIKDEKGKEMFRKP